MQMGQRLQGQQGLLPGAVLRRRYRIISRLGNGGFGAVYKTEDMPFGNRLVAVKEMNHLSGSDAERSSAAEEFTREAMLLARLKHPSLPSIYDHFSEDGRWYLVMDYIEGETLEARLDRVRRFRAEDVLRVGLQLGDVLNYLHSNQPPIIFRDLKPANIIVTPQGHLYLIDFGLARLFDPAQGGPSATFGSPGYAAPEQYDSPQTTVRADIYSLGATLHQMLTGVHPSVRPFEFAPLRFAPSTPLADLGALIMRMLEISPAQRPESMAVVVSELRRIATQLQRMSAGMQRQGMPQPGTLPTPHPPSAASSSGSLAPGRAAPALSLTPGRNFTSRRTPTTFSNAGLPAPPVGMVYTILQGHAGAISDLAWSPDGSLLATASSDGSVRIWNAATGQQRSAYSNDTRQPRAVAWSPDGSRLAIGYHGEKRDTEVVQIVLAQSGERVNAFDSSAGFWRAHDEKTIYAIAWSPDGTKLAWGGRESKVDVLDVRARRLLATYKGHNSTVYALAWSPDGRQIASTGADDAIHLWDALSGRNAATYFKHSSVVTGVAWSSNGQRIVSASHDRTAYVWNAITGTTLTTYRGHGDYINTVAWSPDGIRIATGGRDGQVHLWDASRGATLFVYNGHKASVQVVRWSPDGKRLATGGADYTIHLWRAA
jgi:WD40 repeat protein